MVKTCCVRGCRNKTTPESPWSFHLLPREPELRKQWLRNIGGDVTSKYAAVCSAHFKKEDFFPMPASGKAQLRGNAVPSIFGFQTVQVPQRKLSSSFNHGFDDNHMSDKGRQPHLSRPAAVPRGPKSKCHLSGEQSTSAQN